MLHSQNDDEQSVAISARVSYRPKNRFVVAAMGVCRLNKCIAVTAEAVSRLNNSDAVPSTAA